MANRSVTRGLGILVLLLTGAIAVSAESSAPTKIVYYNQLTAEAAVGQFDDYGNHVTLSTYTPDFVPWTSVVSTPVGILYYLKQTGLAMLGRLDAMGNHTIIKYFDPGWDTRGFPGWTHVVSHNGYLFFYNSLNGEAAVSNMYPDGYMDNFFFLDGSFVPGWTHIVSTKNGLLFYSQNTG